MTISLHENEIIQIKRPPTLPFQVTRDHCWLSGGRVPCQAFSPHSHISTENTSYCFVRRPPLMTSYCLYLYSSGFSRETEPVRGAERDTDTGIHTPLCLSVWCLTRQHSLAGLTHTVNHHSIIMQRDFSCNNLSGVPPSEYTERLHPS